MTHFMILLKTSRQNSYDIFCPAGDWQSASIVLWVTSFSKTSFYIKTSMIQEKTPGMRY